MATERSRDRTWILAELRSRRLQLVGLAGGGFAFMVVLGLSYKALGRDALGRAFTAGHVPAALQALSGSREGDILSPQGWISFGFSHPLYLTVTLAVAVSIAAGVIAGEVETGRAELIFTRPVTRSRFYTSGLALWAIAQLIVIVACGAGALLGGALSTQVRDAGLVSLMLAPLQYLPLALLVASVAFLSSARARTRAAALAPPIAFVVFAYLVNFTAGVASGLAWMRWLTPFGYYDPYGAVTGGLQWAKAGGLAAVAIVLLLAGRAAFERRDLT